MIEDYLSTVSKLIDECAAQQLAGKDKYNAGLYDAMRYSFLSGGKKLRPALLLMGYNLFDERPLDIQHPALPYAAAMEMIHVYSLIHDDLPAMDDDDLRRGKATNHKVYGEATAILAGDALLTKAFEIFARPVNNIPLDRLLTALYTVANSAGSDGMIGGQYADVLAKSDGDKDLLDYIHLHKTARLIAGSITVGGILGGASSDDVSVLVGYGMLIGMAFQIVDDILDVTSSTEALGKAVGSDEKQDKLTYVKIYGLEKAKSAVSQLVSSAVKSVEVFAERGKVLVELACFVGERSK